MTDTVSDTVSRAYDSIPYPSYCYPQSSPAHLCAQAQVFGLSAPDLDTARVLEIGCASGGNIIPLAARFPKAKFVGLDLSAAQVEVAQARAEQLGLKNLSLHAQSITDHSFKRGDRFDYIIAHGVYSWVLAPVQARILEICGQHLSKNGVAFISYNTLPGWNAVKTIRDMMLYHGQSFDDLGRKVLEARNMLKFVADNMKNQSGPYKETLEAEIKILQSADDNYLLHEHLEVTNDPCYFHEFAEQAAAQGLTYMADSDLPSMFLGNQTEKVSGTLSQINDPVRLEQYLDFVTNRRFRSSLLVRAGTTIDRRLSPERLKNSRLIPQYRFQEPVEDAPEELELAYVSNAEQKAKVQGRLACAAMIEILNALPNRLTVAEVAQRVAPKLKDAEKTTPEDLIPQLGQLFLNFMLSGVFTLSNDQTTAATAVSEKPAAFPAAVVIGRDMSLLPNLHHEVVRLGDDQRLVLQYVSGDNTVDDITAAVRSHITRGELTLNVQGEPLTPDSPTFDDNLHQYVQTALNIFAANALLVS